MNTLTVELESMSTDVLLVKDQDGKTVATAKPYYGTYMIYFPHDENVLLAQSCGEVIRIAEEYYA